MRRPFRDEMRDESGASIVEFVICLPILLLLACGLIDLAGMVVVGSQAHAAASAAARTVLVSPASTDAQLKVVALSEAPSVSESEMTLSTKKGATSSKTYEHKFDRAGTTKRESKVTTQPDTVTVTIKRKYVTAIGKTISGSDTYETTATSTVDLDRTNGGNW